MAQIYYVNKNSQPTGEHEIHTETCIKLPENDNRLYLGYFYNCNDAIKEAEKYYSNIDGCYYCCGECHTK